MRLYKKNWQDLLEDYTSDLLQDGHDPVSVLDYLDWYFENHDLNEDGFDFVKKLQDDIVKTYELKEEF